MLNQVSCSLIILMLQELKDENGRLYKLLAERDEEMRILRKQVNQERQAIAGKAIVICNGNHIGVICSAL